jgi:flagellar hook-length control protein FliK
LTRATPARNGTSQPNTSPFQDALALELGLAPDGPLLPGAGVPATAAKAGSSFKSGDDAAQAALAADAPSGLAVAGLPPLPGALAPIPPPAVPGAGTLQPALASLSPPAVAGAARMQPALASVSPPAAPGAAALSPAFAATGTERAGLAPDPRKDLLAKAAAAQKSELQSPITPGTADFAVPGKFSPSAEGEIRREAAFDASLLEQNKTALTPSAAIHSAAAAPAQAAQAPVAAAAAALEARVGERGWDQGLGDKLVWMAGHRQQVAELHLNPPDLGPLKITLTLNNDQASAQFVSAHAQVREALETAMPRLREMLADSGITLGNASVSTDAFREQAQAQHQPRAYPAAPAAEAANPAALTRGEHLLRQAHGLVDTFA